METAWVRMAGVFGAAAILAGCAGPPVYGPRHAETVYVAPSPYVEHVSPPPVVGQVWISGYWNRGGSRQVWVPGHWDRPRHGHHRGPHRQDPDGDRWRNSGGHGERGNDYRPRPQHPGVRPVEPVSTPNHNAPPGRDGRHRLQREVLPPHALP
jgi:hypothetical protein